MFVDEIIIKLEAGRGGDGCTSFHHEKFVEKGGPDGGNGGNGGDIIFVGDKGLKTLIDLRYKKSIKGEKGVNGKGDNKTGANGSNTYIKVPIGTTVSDIQTNLIICDITKDGEEYVICKGGKGGRGNASFKSNKNKAPTTSEYGLAGEIREVKCELKLLADVGLVGLPSVGKSSIISRISASKPKIADYHFTTLTPNLGVVSVKGESYTVADLPGIIEGASEGVGLGDKFLRHALRTKVICYVLDMSQSEGSDVVKDYEILKKEVKLFNQNLFNKKSIVIANKMDYPSAKENLERFKSIYSDVEVIPTSAVTMEGLEELKIKLLEILNTITDTQIYEDNEFESYVLYEFKNEKPYEIKRVDTHTWVITGEKLETILKRTRFNSDEAVLKFASKLKTLGVDDELTKLGAVDGDTVRILDKEFEYNQKLKY